MFSSCTLPWRDNHQAFILRNIKLALSGIVFGSIHRADCVPDLIGHTTHVYDLQRQ